MKGNAIVVGSGISGLGISKMLQVNYNVKVLERADKTGGLIKCTRVDGNLFHLVGGHVFNSNNGEVLDWFWNHFDRDKEFVMATRKAKILINNQIIGYPIENFIWQLPKTQAKTILKELKAIIAGNTDPRNSPDFEVFLKRSFGETLYDIYFGPYNTKLWNTDLGKIPLEWLEGKLPMPGIADILSANRLKRAEAGMVHSTFYYPIYDGSQFIINRLAHGLDIGLSYEVSSVKYKNGMILVNNSEYTTDTLVYCGDVRMLHNIIQIEDNQLKNALHAVKNLLSNGTSNVLCETDEADISWLYLPENKFKAHRIIYTGNFSETNSKKRKTCVVEFSGKHDEETIINELKLLPGNLKPLSFNYEPNSYIIHQKDTRTKIAELKQQLEKYNIHLLGRFAEWEYYNMDKCIEAAMALSNKLHGNN